MKTIALLGLCLVLAGSMARASPLLSYVGQCAPFARAASGIQIYGDAWTWWNQAKGRYQRGGRPRVGSVVVFAKTDRLPLGHVAVVSHVVDGRVVMLTHTNWSRQNGEREHVEQDVTLSDVSQNNDWSDVRVWYRDVDGLGGSRYPVYGFIYGTSDRGSGQVRAVAAAHLAGRHPDDIAALIDAYAH